MAESLRFAAVRTSCLFLLALALALPALAGGPAVCHDEGRYRVIARPTDAVGTDFLVKRHLRGRSLPPCRYLPRPGDIEIPNEDAEYFLGLQGDFLVLDSGTAPEPRGLRIWDLAKRQKVYSGSYSQPVTIDAGGVRFWQETGPASDAACPQAAHWREQHLGAAMEAEVRMGFADLRVVPLGPTRCSARQ